MAASTRIGEGPSITTRLTLTPRVPAAIYSNGGLLRGRQGEDITLHCSNVGEPRPTVLWNHRGRRLGDDSSQGTKMESDRRRLLQADGRILLQDARRDDSGNYTCTASNEHGSDSITHVLSVLGECDMLYFGKNSIAWYHLKMTE